MATKGKEKKLPRYKRQIRYVCWKLSKGWQVKNKIEKSNQWASENRKTFFALVVGILSFIFVTTAISTLYDLTRSNSNNTQMDFSGKTESIENIQPMMNGLRQIDERKKGEKIEIKQLTDRGITIHKELDSLLAIDVKSHSDSVRIIQDYRQLENIVKFLKKGK
ncbi:hypothetical protein [Prevotella ihumii]|uniref:hypothetical protein n=1 Tax=Prevotella ihumii TaxID=1917878 RepID=UPI0009821A09|nr:hypothetical protein [Prevotella ihumii]